MVLSNKEWLDKMDEIISAIQNGGCDSQVIEDMLSNMWISSATYNVGDYVLYNNNIWKCLAKNSNIAPSEGTTWTKVNITNEISTLNSNLDLCNDFGSLYFINSFNHSTDTLVTWGYIKCRYFLLSIESEIEGTRINSIMIPTSQNGSDILYSSNKQHIISGKNISDADCKAIFKPMSENSATIRTVNCSLKLYAIK